MQNCLRLGSSSLRERQHMGAWDKGMTESEGSPGYKERPNLNSPPPPTKGFIRCKLGRCTVTAAKSRWTPHSTEYARGDLGPSPGFKVCSRRSRGTKSIGRCLESAGSPEAHQGKKFFPAEVKNKTSIAKTSSSYWFFKILEHSGPKYMHLKWLCRSSRAKPLSPSQKCSLCCEWVNNSEMEFRGP